MRTSKKLTIAIDGPAASGKSTTARLLAQKLGYIYIDTGAMYRAATLAVLQQSIAPDAQHEAQKVVASKTISLKIENGIQNTYLNGINVSKEIRQPLIDQNVSLIAANGGIRKLMVAQQQAMASKGGVVMDGRDIGTVVLPDADLKIFMVASIEARAKRRLKDQSAHNVDLEEIKKDIERRDHIDSTRKDAPLTKAHDARELDNSDLSIDEQVALIMDWIAAISV